MADYHKREKGREGACHGKIMRNNLQDMTSYPQGRNIQSLTLLSLEVNIINTLKAISLDF